MLFEVEDLAEASPATVSRCGMVSFLFLFLWKTFYDALKIYLDIEMIGWRPCVESWLGQKKDKEKVEILRRLLEKYIQQVLFVYSQR
jgi:dynein heavy chain